jgi:hypothetical protein
MDEKLAKQEKVFNIQKKQKKRISEGVKRYFKNKVSGM